MNLPKENLDTYWNSLKICEYPNIPKMDELDVRKIFEKENRIPLLTWALLKLIPDCSNRLELGKSCKKLDIILGDLIYINGFCKINEKEQFVSEQKKMKLTQEIPIFNRIFLSLNALYSDIDKENLTSEVEGLKYLLLHPTREHIENRILRDINIFPSHVHYKKMSEEERMNKREQLKKEIEWLNEEIKIRNAVKEKKTMTLVQENMEECQDVTKEKIESLMKKLNSVISTFAKDFPEYSLYLSKSTNVATNPSLGPALEKCNKSLDFILRILEGENYLVNESQMATTQNGDDNSTDDFSDFVMQNYLKSAEIISESKHDGSINSV